MYKYMYLHMLIFVYFYIHILYIYIYMHTHHLVDGTFGRFLFGPSISEHLLPALG